MASHPDKRDIRIALKVATAEESPISFALKSPLNKSAINEKESGVINPNPIPKNARKTRNKEKELTKADATPETVKMISPEKRICLFLNLNVSCPESKLKGMINKAGKFNNICSCKLVVSGKDS